MSTRITLRLNTSLTERAVAKLGQRAPFAIAKALNRSITSARQSFVQSIATDMGLQQTKIRDRIWLQKAYPEPNGLVAKVTASPERIPLGEFSPTGPMPTRGRGQGVSVRFRAMGQRRRYLKLFKLQFRSGHVGVYGRASSPTRKSRGAWSKNLPIVERKGPSIMHSATNFTRAAAERGRDSLQKNLQHEIDYLLKQASA